MAHCFLYSSSDYISAENAVKERASSLVANPHDLLFATNQSFEPDPKKKENVALTVNAARAICRESYGVPIGARKGFIFPHADLMTLNAQNALLKLFEEPPENVVFFLVTDKPHALLSTIRSRCESVSVLGEDKVRSALFGQLEALANFKNDPGKEPVNFEKPSDMHRMIAFCVEHKDEKDDVLNSLEEIFRARLLQNNAKTDILKKIAVARLQVKANCNWNAVVWGLFQ